jgi:NadR type nicotinamide-nucleotide adenylyltransferase
MLKKIVVIGPESTGKSTLCNHLAQHYQTLWCKEFAREYLLLNGTNYTYNDLLIIAKKQIELEDSFDLKIKNYELATKDQRLNTKDSNKNSILFIDTDMYVMKVWCEYVFGKCHNFILNEIATRKYDLYLLCNIDLPWVADELREYPNEKPRKELFAIYKDILVNQTTPWHIISGTNEERFNNAVNAINKQFCIE